MKCPKCHYLSFDPEPRCRNCGYTLSLDPDLVIHPDPGPDGPPVDLALRDAAPVTATKPTSDERPRSAPARRASPPAPGESPRRARTTTPGPFDDEQTGSMPGAAEDLVDSGRGVFDAEVPPPAATGTPSRPSADPRTRRQPPPPTTELPLFVKGIGTDATARALADDLDDEIPLIDPPASAAPPLSVRRSTPDGPTRSRAADAHPKFGPLDRDLLEGLQRIEHAEQRQAAAEARRARVETAAEPGKRLAAAAIDACLLGGLATGIVAMTLRWSDLGWSHVLLLPAAPLAAFVLLVVAGYLFMFTAASGQTAGKMLMGIRVIDAGDPGSGEHRVSVRQALYRGALTIPSVLLLGAGFLPVLTGDGRAVHDRLTQTRVVRA